MANSGGGSILVGVDNDGKCCGQGASEKLLAVDPAVITDKIAKYTGVQFESFVIGSALRSRSKIALITIGSADPPLVFEKPGTYAIEGGKQKTAFGAGTLYVRHGAKSEPARSADITKLIDRHLHRARREWLSGVKRITTAPPGSTISMLPPQVIQSSDPNATPIRITDDPSAPGYQHVDPDKTHPWREKELVEEINKALPTTITPYDLRAVRRVHDTDQDPNFVYNHRYGPSKQYSPAFAKWILERYAADPRFFQKCRAAIQPAQVVVSTDTRLQWIPNYMQKNSLSGVKMARRLTISASTLTRLLAGTYAGNVDRMIQRIEQAKRMIDQNS